MIFFTDQYRDVSSKIGITSLLSNITQRPGSHKGGWARLLKCQLKVAGFENVTILKNGDNLNDFDCIIFDLGAEYSGTLNLFGGLDKKCYQRVYELHQFQGKLFSWRNELPDLVGCIKSRLDNASTHAMFSTLSFQFLLDLGYKLGTTVRFDHVYATDKLLFGDSHTPSIWDPTYMIERRDGRTLNGVLVNESLSKYVRQFEEHGVKLNQLMVHCGSIDIRHHVGRSLTPEYTIATMAENWIRNISTFGFTSVKLMHSVGIEDESRELPKSGYFKGEPFSQSWEKRNLYRNIFNEVLEQAGSEYGYEVLEFPKYFFDESGKMRFDVMEVPQSIHVSPEHYRWNLDKNELRWTESYDIHQLAHYATLHLLGKIEKDMYEPR